MTAVSKMQRGRDDRVFENFIKFESTTCGKYLAQALVESEVETFFTVPGDYNLTLLDELLKHPALHMVGCCNELNAGYAADGYSRQTGKLSCCVVTYTVGSLSCINAIAGAYSADIPLLLVTGGPNRLDAQNHHLIHHTIGEYETDQCSKCFAPVVAKVIIIRNEEEIVLKINDAIKTCLYARKPVYLEIACNLANVSIPLPAPIHFSPHEMTSDPLSLEMAISDISERLRISVRPVLIGGSKLIPSKNEVETLKAFEAFANTLGAAVTVMPDAKGLFPESHPLFIGTYWPMVSSAFADEIISSSDCQLFCCPVFNDYTTTGWSILSPIEKLICIGPTSASMNGKIYDNVFAGELLRGLIPKVAPKSASIESYRRLYEPSSSMIIDDGKLSQREVRRQIQSIITENTTLIIETGDAWFIGQKFHLPDQCKYHVQMQYGSIGWSVGATLGSAIAAAEAQRRAPSSVTPRIITLVGDGSFQMSAQELSTIVRFANRWRSIDCIGELKVDVEIAIFILNNRGYTIEVEIHDGPYNDIANWDYASLVKAFDFEEETGAYKSLTYHSTSSTTGKSRRKHIGVITKHPTKTRLCQGVRVSTGKELTDVLFEFLRKTDDSDSPVDQASSEPIRYIVNNASVTVIECILDRDDCTSELLNWGSRVASANMRR